MFTSFLFYLWAGNIQVYPKTNTLIMQIIGDAFYSIMYTNYTHCNHSVKSPSDSIHKSNKPEFLNNYVHANSLYLP